MAMACSCDRCGEFFAVRDARKRDNRKYVIMASEHINNIYHDCSIDLCDKCNEEFEQFMNQSRNSQTL